MYRWTGDRGPIIISDLDVPMDWRQRPNHYFRSSWCTDGLETEAQSLFQIFLMYRWTGDRGPIIVSDLLDVLMAGDRGMERSGIVITSTKKHRHFFSGRCIVHQLFNLCFLSMGRSFWTTMAICNALSTHTYIHTYMHACMHAYIHTYIHTYIYTYIIFYIASTT